jgi:medium-chain acyl-[acyl-carrier-protein] hydrolase
MNNATPLSQTIQLRQAQCDLAGRLTMSQLFLIMQEIAGDDSDRTGLGRQFVADNDIFWVISRASVDVLRPAKAGERVVVTTWHGKAVRYIFPRFFTVESETGERLYEAATLWMLIDRKDRSIVFPSMRGFAMSDPPDLPDIQPPPGKIAMPFALDKSALRTPVYSDFDANGHMNNARYPLWICDLFDLELYQEKGVRSLQVNFMREIMAGDQVEMRYGMQGDVFAVRGATGESICFEARGSFAQHRNE